MNTHLCLICLGSNKEYTHRLSNARKALCIHFPDIRFGKEMKTEAIGSHFLSPFGNQLGKFTTTLLPEEIRPLLKQIEKDNGRMADDKQKGIVKLDIDLLMYDDFILKPDDMKRDFVLKGLEEMSMEEQAKKDKVKQKEQIERIQKMDKLLDKALAIISKECIAPNEHEEIQRAIDILSDYYGSDTWKQDFADDEAGLLPKDLKRGVLTEDAIWNLLADWQIYNSSF